jgi:hypothetical protein
VRHWVQLLGALLDRLLHVGARLVPACVDVSCVVGKGKVAHWDFATYEEDDIALTVALQPHRNPSKNGTKLLLFDNRADSPKVRNEKSAFCL